jgi:maltose O-acetyltransferase
MNALPSDPEGTSADRGAAAPQPPSVARSTWRSRVLPGLETIARAARNELTLDATQVACSAISRALPQLSFVRSRTAMLRAVGVRIGSRSLVMGPLDITGPGRVAELFSIGDDTFVTGPLHVDLAADVRIGDRVRLGHQVALLTVDHEIGPSEQRCGQVLVAPVIIGDGAWLASHVTILPGVSVGNGSIVAAGAVVTNDVPPNTLVAGVPARVVRDLAEDAPPVSRHRFTPAVSGRPPRGPVAR